MVRRDSPPPAEDDYSWRETLEIIWIVFQTLAVPLGFMVLVLGLLVWIMLALLSNVWLALIPIGIGASVIAWFVRRDRKAVAKLIAERDGLPVPGGPRRPGL